MKVSSFLKRAAVAAVGVAAVFAARGARADLYVAESGDDANPGTEAQPFLSVQAAVDAAPAEGCVVHVAAGTFYAKASVAVPNPVLSVTKPVTIIGAGAGTTFLSAKDKGRYVVKMNCEGAILRDVTLCHADYATSNDTGIGLTLTKGEVRNVIIEDIKGRHCPGAVVSGGALYDSVIRRITSDTNALGIGLTLSGTGLVSGCEIHGLGKAAWNDSVKIAVVQSGGTLENCYIHDNFVGVMTHVNDNTTSASSSFANMSGTGLSISGGRATGCRITRNWCIGHAAGVKVTGSGILENSAVYENASTNIFVASYGAGVTVDGKNAIVRGCVIANNYDVRLGGGLALYNGTVTNNHIFAHAVTNVTVKGGTFEDNRFYNPGISDLTTYARPAADAFSCSFTVDRDFIRDNAGGEVTFTAAAENAPGAVTYTWDFGDGGAATGSEVTHAFGVGRHTVTLTATSGGQTAVCKTKDAITVYPQKVYVGKGVTPKFPYTSSTDAAAEIEDVMALFPSEIEVGAGTYSVRNHYLYFAYPVTVTGAGRDVAIVDAQGKGGTRGLVLSDPAASVSGLQFYNANNCVQWDSCAGVILLNGTVSNCWVRKATSYGNIGALLYGGRLVDSLITESVSGSAQRGFAATLRGGSMYGCVISNNTTTTSAMLGVVYVENSASVVSNCTICCNQLGSATTANAAGTVYLTAGTVTHCRITDNKISSTGGGAYLSGGTLRNCLVSGNSTILTAGSSGGGVYNNGGRVENCTVVGNTATGTGDGLYQANGTTVNTIVYNNTADNLVLAGGIVTNSCMTPVVSGEGNTATAPAFVSAANGDWHLTSLSKAQIDHAAPLAWMTADAVDLDGKARVVNDVPDMGCYEYEPSPDEPFIAQFSASVSSTKVPAVATFTAVVSKYPIADCTFLWSFGDSAEPETVVGSAEAQHTYETAGSFTVRLVVRCGTEETAPFEVPSCVTVVPTTCYVSKTGTNTYPYDTLGKAASDLLTAYAVNSDEIVVSNGTYATSTIILNRAAKIRSLNGRETVTLKPSATGTPYIYMNVDGAVLSDLVVSSGTTGDWNAEYGSGIRMSAGTVSNCVVRNCTQYKGGAIYMSGTARLLDSVVSNNNSWAGSALAGGIMMNGANTLVSGCRILRNFCKNNNDSMDGGAGACVESGTMTNCVIAGNSGNNTASMSALTVKGGLVTHCIITNNDMYAFAGGVWLKGGTLRNCLIAGNVTHGTRDGDGSGGLRQDGGTAESLTVAGNVAAKPGGGVHQTAGTLLNSIVYDNVSPDAECRITGGTRVNCLSAGGLTGTDCVVGDPQFTDAAAGDYRLSVLSPAKNKGSNQTWMEGALDLAGFTRISGEIVDIGAYEIDADAPIPLMVAFEATSSVRLADDTTRITFTPTVVGSVGMVTLTWDFGDGTDEVESGIEPVSHVYRPGAYTVKVKAYDATLAKSTEWVVRTDYAVAIPRVSYVATGDDVEPKYPYASPTNGAATLNEAISVGSDEICIMPGTYSAGETIKIARDVTIYSQSGNPNDVKFVCTIGKDQSLLCNMNSAGAVLRGVTLSGGSNCTWNYGGATLELSKGTVENCILENGTVWKQGTIRVTGGIIRQSVIRGHLNRSGGDCVALHLNGGTVDGCVITNNASSSYSSNVVASAVYFNGTNARLSNSLVAYNGGSDGAGVCFGSGGELLNCTIVSNVAAYSSAGVCGSAEPTLCENNIVWGNVAPATPDIAAAAAGHFTYSCSPALTSGRGNTVADPQFRNPARGDWRLLRTSPCVNKGDWTALGATKDAVRAQKDLLGAARLQGPNVDMGACEARGGGFTLIVR